MSISVFLCFSVQPKRQVQSSFFSQPKKDKTLPPKTPKIQNPKKLTVGRQSWTRSGSWRHLEHSNIEHLIYAKDVADLKGEC